MGRKISRSEPQIYFYATILRILILSSIHCLHLKIEDPTFQNFHGEISWNIHKELFSSQNTAEKLDWTFFLQHIL